MYNTKIFISNHTLAKRIDSKIYTSIQVGRANAINILDMLGDNTGDNISMLNHNFCELTAIYWVWKQYQEIGEPDYIGFMHYRRHFLFGNKNYQPNFYGLVKFEKIDKKYIEEDICTDDKVNAIINNYDAIIPQAINVQETVGQKNNYIHYKYYHNIADYQKTIDIINKKYPEMMKYVNEYNNSQNAYFLNMFIFKKDIFFDYCEWIFSILFELFEEIDLTNNTYQDRVFGFISERLTGIYITKLLDTNLKIKSLPVSFIQNTNPTKEDFPNISENTIPIVVASSNEYIPQLSVFAESIRQHSDKNYIYEINVLERNITKENADILREQFKNSNIKFNYIHINSKLDDLAKECQGRHFSVDTFSRFFIPKQLPQYDKCIYCDLDTIIMSDIKELYNTDLENKALAACRDWVFHGLCKNVTDKKIQDYALNTLKLEKCDDYFQGGIQVMNLKKMREINSEITLCNLANKLDVYFVDQCLYNYYFRGDVKYLSRDWNYQINDRERKEFKLFNMLPVPVIQELTLVKENPKIIHYSGPWKPWFYPDEEFAGIWWQYAKQTPFYELIIKRMTENTIKTSNDINKKINFNIFAVRHYKKICLNYWRTKLLSKVTVGKTRKHYIDKRNKLKELIRTAKKL